MNRLIAAFRVLAGYAVAVLGAYLMVATMKPLSLIPFVVGLVLVFGGLIFAHPDQGIPMLGYLMSAIRNMAAILPWTRSAAKEPRPHAHRRQSDATVHEHRRKRMSVSEFTISRPVRVPHPRDVAARLRDAETDARADRRSSSTGEE